MNPSRIKINEPLRFQNDDYVTPPGTVVDRLSHPFFDKDRSVDVSAFFEHRYAFFFWVKWYRELRAKKIIDATPPSLVTLDWHQDLGWPTKEQKTWLDQLDLNSNIATNIFSWSSLSQFNDDHIMAAVYLNLIGDVYVHCRQRMTGHRQEDQEYTDKYGNVHMVRKFGEFETMEEHLLKQKIANIYFDIDLDFFVVDNPYSVGGGKRGVKNFSYLPDKTIKAILDRERPLISWIFQRLCGFTIAIEPEHTGGLMRAIKYLNLIDRLYFKPSLFTNCGFNWDGRSNWKHL